MSTQLRSLLPILLLLSHHVSSAPQPATHPFTISNGTITPKASTDTTNSTNTTTTPSDDQQQQSPGPDSTSSSDQCNDRWPHCYDDDPAYNTLDYYHCNAAFKALQSDKDYGSLRSTWTCSQPGTVRAWYDQNDSECIISIGCQSAGVDGSFYLSDVEKGFESLGAECEKGGKELLWEPQVCGGEAWYVDVYNASMLGGTYVDFQSDAEGAESGTQRRGRVRRGLASLL